MGGCSAPFCNNSSSKGYLMKIFPRDPIRRALWVKNVPRENWSPTRNSFLCEIHFTAEMWEQNCSGKLRKDAVPTIFGFFLKKPRVNTSQENYDDNNQTKESVNDVDNNAVIANRQEFLDNNSSNFNTEQSIHSLSQSTIDKSTLSSNQNIIEVEDINNDNCNKMDTVNQQESPRENFKNSTVEPNWQSATKSITQTSTEAIIDKVDVEGNSRYKELLKKQQLQLFLLRKKLKAYRKYKNGLT
ncbi:THAP domain-containing protein 2-like [Prorops nasuta]|uniref:THAP domain-containing protein 2-like n=1 Tax=Prorops nasuta TaxID=863751 RepID=UPI0034CF5D44